MTMTPSKPLFKTSRRVYQWLLLAYPTKFRQAHGAEMLQVFRASLREEDRQRGTVGVAHLWLLTIVDLAMNALALRLSS